VGGCAADLKMLGLLAFSVPGDVARSPYPGTEGRPARSRRERALRRERHAPGTVPSPDLRRWEGALAPRRDGDPARGASAGVSHDLFLGRCRPL
jgi:hypothetical protein